MLFYVSYVIAGTGINNELFVSNSYADMQFLCRLWNCITLIIDILKKLSCLIAFVFHFFFFLECNWHFEVMKTKVSIFSFA